MIFEAIVENKQIATLKNIKKDYSSVEKFRYFKSGLTYPSKNNELTYPSKNSEGLDHA